MSARMTRLCVMSLVMGPSPHTLETGPPMCRAWMESQGEHVRQRQRGVCVKPRREQHEQIGRQRSSSKASDWDARRARILGSNAMARFVISTVHVFSSWIAARAASSASCPHHCRVGSCGTLGGWSDSMAAK